MKNRSALTLIVIALATAALLSCEYDCPLTAPTRPVEPNLVGDWTSITPEREWMKIRKLDETHYIVVRNGDLFRVHHSDLAGMSLASVENIDSGNGKWSFVSWELAESGKVLLLRTVNDKLVPDDAKSPAQLITANRANPELLTSEIAFRRN